MTVQELIDELKKYKPEAKVVVLKENGKEDYQFIGRTEQLTQYFEDDPQLVAMIPEMGHYYG